MSDQAVINLVGCIVWFFIGAAVLSVTGRGLLDITEAFSKDESIKNVVLPGLGIPGVAAFLIFCWLIACLLWPRTLVRYFQGRGLVNGHIARDCEHREQYAEKHGEPRYQHGRPCRRKERKTND